LIESSVNGDRLNIKISFSIPLDTTKQDIVMDKIKETVNGDRLDFQRIYNNECQKYLENKKAAENQFATNTKKVDDTPKINLDTKQLDAAIKKTDELISKLKTAQNMINKIGIPF